MMNFISISHKEISANRCIVKAVANFEGYPRYLPVFREAWLNRDFFVDFYKQRRKQVLLYTVLKRYAEVITEGIYSGAANERPNKCSFEINIQAPDLYGRIQQLPAISWKFTKQQADQINWEKFDPRDFSKIAINYTIAPGMKAWISDEPDMANQAQPLASESIAGCDESFVRANAIFIRATATYCKKNYMDGPAGLHALAMTRQCINLGKSELESISRSAMEELDRVVNQRGKTAACQWVDRIEQEVMRSATK